MIRAASGTIIAASNRDSYAIIAADRLACTDYPDGSFRTRVTRKVFCHNTLPIAVATAGLYSMDYSGWHKDGRVIPIKVFIKLYFDQISELESNLIENITENAEHYLLPGIRAIKEKDSRAHTWLAIAYYYDDRTRLYQLGIRDSVKSAPVQAVIQTPDQSIERMYKRNRKEHAKHLGESISDPSGLSNHLKQTIESGIRFDTERTGGRNRHAGFGVDVAIVDGKGARFVFRRSSVLSWKFARKPSRSC